MSKTLTHYLRTEIKHLDHAGLLPKELLISSPQGPTITVGGKSFVNLTSSDYLGLAHHADVKRASIEATQTWGVGMAASRMMAGTLLLHAQLEQAVAEMLGVSDAIVYPSGYEANIGLFESLLSHRDYVFADEQIGPSLADGLRLARGRVYSYRNQDMAHLEDLLKRSRAARFRLIVTDGVFPISGLVAQLGEIYALAEKYDALVIVDDSQGIGVLGESGRGTHSHLGVTAVDVVTGTFGHAMGGGAGGFVAGPNEVITWLRQKSRPYLSSVALPPPAAAAAHKAIELLRRASEQRTTLQTNLRVFRDLLGDNGLWTTAGPHPAVSVLIRSSTLAQRFVDHLFTKGVLAIGFCPPVVPEGAARVRAQLTARHSHADLRVAVQAFADAAKELNVPLERHKEK